MIRLLFQILALLASSICSEPGYRSSLMHEGKPILRLGPDKDAPKNTDEGLKEPKWVTNLRTNIQHQINEAGFEDAKPDIQTLIQQANFNVNGDKTSSSESGQINNPEVRVPYINPLRNRPGQVDWESDLKSYIKELMAAYGTKNLEKYVKPVISSIEGAHNVKIKDIDVNPYGQVSVNYDRSSSRSYSFFPEDPRVYQREDDDYGTRFTMEPE